MPKPPPPIYGWPEEKSRIRKYGPELVALTFGLVVLLGIVLLVARGC